MFKNIQTELKDTPWTLKGNMKETKVCGKSNRVSLPVFLFVCFTSSFLGLSITPMLFYLYLHTVLRFGLSSFNTHSLPVRSYFCSSCTLATVNCSCHHPKCFSVSNPTQKLRVKMSILSPKLICRISQHPPLSDTMIWRRRIFIFT